MLEACNALPTAFSANVWSIFGKNSKLGKSRQQCQFDRRMNLRWQSRKTPAAFRDSKMPGTVFFAEVISIERNSRYRPRARNFAGKIVRCASDNRRIPAAASASKSCISLPVNGRPSAVA